jgi:hypothetical protein
VSAREGSRSPVAVRPPLIDTLRRRRARFCKDPHLRSVREEAGENPGQGGGWNTLEGKSPREPPAVGGLITCRS